MQKLNVPVRVGIVGCGQIGKLHAKRLAGNPAARLVALFDSHSATANQLAKEHDHNPRVCRTFDELIAFDGLDAVIICTPTSLHFDQVRACRERGLHVLCEKPLADTRGRIQTLMEESARGGPLLAVAYQRRNSALYRTLRRELQSGKWGKIQSVASHNCERWQQVQALPGMWRDDPLINPGGFIGDAGSHKIDMVFFATGLKPTEVFAHSDRHGCHVEIVTTVSARLEGGASLNMSFLGNAQHFREDLQISCTEADILIRENELWIAQDNRLEKLKNLEAESDPVTAMIECLTEGTENVAPASCALPVFDFTQAILESSQTGRLAFIPE